MPVKQVLASAGILIALGALGGTAWAHSDPPPSSVGRVPCSRCQESEWHLHFGVTYRDTVSASPRDARVAAAAALENDKWILEPQGTDPGLLTEWKPIRNILFRFFSGKAFARIFIDVTPVSRNRSEIRFQGGLATRRDIEHNPAMGFAERHYASAVRDWHQDVRLLIASSTTR